MQELLVVVWLVFQLPKQELSQIQASLLQALDSPYKF